MRDASKLADRHRAKLCVVYVRQSSYVQVERNRESTARQYDLVARAAELGWSKEAVLVIDDDLGLSGSGTAHRAGFARLAAEVGLGHVGLILSLEASRLARSNADWYRLLDLCSLTGTLIADTDGIYDPADYSDRLALGLKGTIAESELHVLKARLHGGIRNKAARGELRMMLPVGLVWGEEDGQVLLHPDEAVRGAIQTVFDRFDELGSARATWIWYRGEGLTFPYHDKARPDLQWVTPTYLRIHRVLTHPAYAGAYVFGSTRLERYLDEDGQLHARRRQLPMEDWQVLIVDHHADQAYITWDTYLANQARIDQNTRPQRHEPGTGALREGCALLQGLAVCGRCGRKLAVHYNRDYSTPGYHCHGRNLAEGRAERCLSVGGIQIDRAVTEAFLAALAPAGVEAALAAAEALAADRDMALAQWRKEVERARYQASLAERRYMAVDPDNRLVARGLEADWEAKLAALAGAEAELARKEAAHPARLGADERKALSRLGNDLNQVWQVPTTTDRDRKELLRTLLEEVVVDVDREAGEARLTLRWRGGAMSELRVALKGKQPTIRTDEDTIDLIRRLAQHHPDATIAGILNRQGRLSARGQRFTASMISSLRGYWKIARYEPPAEPPEGETVPLYQAAKELGVVPSTLYRWINEGFIGAEQDTPGAPWRIRMTAQLRALFVDGSPPGWLAMLEATMALGVSRQTVLQRVKRGELQAVIVRSGRRKGLRIKVPEANPTLFNCDPSTKEAV
jgi:DNA invertase Pin-like site-specific DNA recombinase